MKPVVVLSNAPEQCLTFAWRGRDYHVGYRFVEGQPLTSDTPLSGYESQPAAAPATLSPLDQIEAIAPRADWWLENWTSVYNEPDANASVQLSFRAYGDGSARCTTAENGGKLTRDFLFQPVDDGVWISIRLTTTEPIEGAYCLQQCLRYTGGFNATWRQSVARVLFLSELDMQAMGNPNQSLTYARRDDRWFRFPVGHTVYATQIGRDLLPDSSLPPVDHGLIIRESPSRKEAPQSYWDHVAPDAHWDQVASGMYWERTASVSNRHPADCLHAWIDFGPLDAGQSRTLRGKFYFIEGTRDDLLAAWRKDFSSTDNVCTS